MSLPYISYKLEKKLKEEAHVLFFCKGSYNKYFRIVGPNSCLQLFQVYHDTDKAAIVDR